MPPSKNISFEELSQYFHLPINQVAKELGVCATILKKTCRKNGIPRWPHRKIKSLDNRIANLQVNLEKNPQDRDEIQKEIELLRSKKQEIMKHPDILVRSASRSIEVTSTKMVHSPPSASNSPPAPTQTPPSAKATLPVARNGSDSSLGPLPNLFSNVNPGTSSGVTSNYSMLSQNYFNTFQQPQQQQSQLDDTLSYLSNPMTTRMNEYLAYERYMNSGKTPLVSAPSSLFNAPAPNYVAPPSSLFGDNTTSSPFALSSQQPNAPRDNTIPNPSSLFGNTLPPTTNMNNTMNLQGNNWTVSIGKSYNTPNPNTYSMFSGGYNGMKEMPYDMKYSYEQQRTQAPVVDEKASIQRNISDYIAMARATGMVPPEFPRFPAEDMYSTQRRGFESELASIQANQSYGNYEKPNTSL